MVVLSPGIQVCRDRNATRDPSDRFDFDGYEHLDARMRHDLAAFAWWYDTSAVTPEETAARLVDEAERRCPVLG